VIGLLRVLCGADGWTDLEAFAESKASWLRTLLEMPGALPKEGSSGGCSRRAGRETIRETLRAAPEE
jgi:hypothetical protein